MDIVQEIYEQVLLLQQSHRGALSPKTPLHRIKLFAVDLAMITLCIRTGFLVDAFTIQDTDDRAASWRWNQLLRDLCQRSNRFKSVVHIYDPTSDQSFFINKPLFLSRIRGFLSLYDTDSAGLLSAMEGPNFQPTSFISLSSEGPFNPTFTDVSEGVHAVLRHLSSQIQLISAEDSVQESMTITLPPNLSYIVTVPLAGFLLEYPVAFCPISTPGADTSSFLSQVPLRVYKCFLKLEDKDRTRDSGTNSQQKPGHLLMQFSIPAVLESTHPETHSSTVVESKLHQIFSSRLDKAFAGKTVPPLTVTHSIKTLDRVAL
ncbi:hypothetical protein L218DRAFT_984925 [Marasmius fiardii PR-910]|nr:hypothetical protein L218DRAFT_984925 [Marasmius fiardii PR-910]